MRTVDASDPAAACLGGSWPGLFGPDGRASGGHGGSLWPDVQQCLRPEPKILLALHCDVLVGSPAQRLAPVSAELAALLQQLQRSPRIALALLSGCSVRDLRSQLELNEAIYIGQHGAEIAGPGLTRAAEGGVRHRSDLVDVFLCVKRCLRCLPGVSLFDGGASLKVEMRRARRPARQRIEKLLRALLEQRPRLQLNRSGAGWEIHARPSEEMKRAIEQTMDHLRVPLSSLVYVAGADSPPGTFLGLEAAHTFAVGGSGMAAARYRLPSRREMTQLLLCVLTLVNEAGLG